MKTYRSTLLASFPRLVSIALLAALATACSQPKPPEGPVVTVYKSATCECCGRWAQHMRDSGFAVKVETVNDLAAVRKDLAIPEAVGACHTATVGGYVVQGHVPAGDIKRLLAERPPVKGLATLGMPPGSPGMEMGDRTVPYDVVSFDAAGDTKVFAHH